VDIGEAYLGELEVLSYFIYVSRQSPPAVLSTSRESRLVALKHYKLDFSTTFSRYGTKFHIPKTIYINLAVDIILPVQAWSKHARADLCRRESRHLGWVLGDIPVLSSLED
jgi:hypothetical protein